MKYFYYFSVILLFLSLPLSVNSCSNYHVIVSGDLCWNLASKYGLNVAQLTSNNPGVNCNNLHIGDLLCVSSRDTPIQNQDLNSSPIQCRTHTIVARDICWDLALKYSLTLAQLISYNPGMNCGNLRIGDKLCISSVATIPTQNPSPTTGPTQTTNPTQTPSGSITYNQFKNAVIACGYGAPSDSLYQAFVTQAPSAGGITTRRELAMFLAQILHESGGLVYKSELRCQIDNCNSEYRSYGDDPNLFYYGRGFIQLTWSYNYRSASIALFSDDRLVRNPDLVAQSDEYSWGVSFWFWKANVHNYVQGGQFGSATRAINGGLECSPCRGACSIRFSYYSKILPIFGVNETPDNSGC